MKKAILIILSCTWGFPMTLIGLFATLGLLIAGHRPRRYGIGWYFVVGDGWGGANLGLTTILCKTSAQGTHTLNHETGHALQNCVFGVLMPFLVCIPSVVRYWWRIYQKRKGSTILAEYDAVWFEGQATRWGNVFLTREDAEKALKEREQG